MGEAAGIVSTTRLKRAADAVRAALRAGLDLALPRLCAACREPVEGPGLCPACWSKLSFIRRPYCERLGVPFVYDPGPGILSMEAIADPPAYNRARAAVRFDEISRALVHAFKYGDRLDLAPMMGRWIGNAGGELLAQADAALKRVKATARQVGLSRPERAANIQGAFRVPNESKPAIIGRRLVLIDDVLTSGATVEGCARALLRAGAANVDVLVFARVADPVRTSI
jgi:predicted amidophosphoribosyltransferase